MERSFPCAGAAWTLVLIATTTCAATRLTGEVAGAADGAKVRTLAAAVTELAGAGR